MEDWNVGRMEDWVRPARVRRTCMSSGVYEGMPESEKNETHLCISNV